MKDFLQYVFDEVKNKRLGKTEAVELIRQFQSHNVIKQGNYLHPLLQQNTSNLSEQRFSTIFTGREFFLMDHVIKGQKVLPGVAYLEMAQTALALALGDKAGEGRTGIRLNNVVWARPIAVGEEPLAVHIGIYPEENGNIGYDIYSVLADHSEISYSQGSARLIPGGDYPILDIQTLQEDCSQGIFTPDELYQVYKQRGVAYGPSHQGVEMIYLGDNRVLAKLSLPASVTDTKESFVLHPSMMDSALQASIVLDMNLDKEMNPKPSMPFALQELEILSACTSTMWAFIQCSEGSREGSKIRKYDIDLCDEQGNVCVRLKGYAARVLEGEVGLTDFPDGIGNLMLESVWKEEALFAEKIRDESEFPLYEQYLVIFCEPGDLSIEKVEAGITGIGHTCRCLCLQSTQNGIDERFQTYAVQVFEEVQSILKNKPAGKVLIQVIVSDQGEQEIFAGLSGLLKTASLENRNLVGQVIEMDVKEDISEAIGRLKQNSRSLLNCQIRYHKDKRMVAKLKEVKASLETPFLEEYPIPWRDGGVYLITGGTGGLGMIFAKEIAQHAANAVLVLTGRSPLDEEKKVRLKELGEKGAKFVYRQMDVTDRKAVYEIIDNISKEYGKLNGIIHSAGVILDNYIIKKSKEELQAVLAPKVTGVINLDEASKECSLDFMIFFSSIASMGSAGQADYATANAFMNSYAKYRNSLVVSGQRRGRTLAVNWPLWQEGGMHVDSATEKMITQSTGLVPMNTKNGILALYQSLAFGKDQMMIMEGRLKQLRSLYLESPALITSSNKAVQNKKIAIRESEWLQENADNLFKKLLSAVLKLPADQIDADAPMEKYGIDSIMVMMLTNELEKSFGSLSKTLFFEYQTIKELTGYFLEFHGDRLSELIGNKEKLVVKQEPDSAVENESVLLNELNRRRSRFAPAYAPLQEQIAKDHMDIAIIGIAGRYPQAGNIQEFWENLKNGKDCITEIPKERWDNSLYFTEDKNKPGKIYTKWGGFIDGVDQFDPLFFNISPREAEYMDPQERLFLQCVYQMLEDAGYTRDTIGAEANVGVYVGVMYEEYQLYAAQEQMKGHPITLGGLPASIANRVSYFFNFHGPSISLDTMCSASLTGIHLACQSLQQGYCQLAVAGGVNVTIHPNKYLQISEGRFASSSGRCASFGEGGDGYVPGEGVGALLLKPLTAAISDGDHIYGVIKGTSVNHGGKTNGYTVPNPNAQAQLITRAIKEAGINPRTISYMEAHGTGTALGDPIEITGLTKAFREFTTDNQFCAIGSVKSNIGHCESAAGVAGLTKVLLQFKNCQIAPSLHSNELNHNIDFLHSPFVVQQELTDWKRPSINGKEVPRRAGISSFGAGGANAHVIVEEYISSNVKPMVANSPEKFIIVLSARNAERLREQAQQLVRAIREEQFSDAHLFAIAYTLQIGREAMEERMGIIVESVRELKEKLENFIAGNESIEGLYRGHVKWNKDMIAIFEADEDMTKTVDSWIKKEKYTKFINVWVKGLNYNWHQLYRESKPQRMSLPTYPFARERYWAPRTELQANIVTSNGILHNLHPLLHQNTSSLSEQQFSSTFTGQEFFLENHVIQGRRVLPGVAYLEMARAAVSFAVDADLKKALAAGQREIRLKNVVWVRPLGVDGEAVSVQIELYPEENGEIAYEIYGVVDDEEVVYSQGSAALSMIAEVPTLDLEMIQALCSQRELTSRQLYETFKTMGIEYGPGHQGIEKIYVGTSQVLAKLSLPSFLADTQDHFVLHPSIMDGALQASLGLMMLEKESEINLKPSLPFALQELEILKKCTSAMWAFIRCSEDGQSVNTIQKLDIDLCDENGTCCVRMKGYSSRILENKTGYSTGTLLLTPNWEEQAANKQESQDDIRPVYEQHLIILCGRDEITAEVLGEKASGIGHKQRCISLQSKTKEIGPRYQAYATQVFAEIQNILQEKPKGKVLIQLLVFGSKEQQLFAGLSGLLKTARLENPNLIGQVIQTDYNENVNEILAKLAIDSLYPEDTQVSYEDGKRRIPRWSEVTVNESLAPNGTIPWKNGGIYLITGGAGGLGLLFANEIMNQVKEVTLVLTGRSPLSQNKRDKLNKLETGAAKVIYRQVDVTDRKAVYGLVQNIQETFGNINGIIHSAGIIKDNFIIKKSKEEFLEVLGPKVVGTINLDEATKELNLDLFILFSSGSGVSGNIGQADYSAANAFMDAYVRYRSGLVEEKQRSGQTLAMDWPLWKEGGMHVDESVERMMWQTMGMVAMQTPSGIQALYQALAAKKNQVMVVEGDLTRLRAAFLSSPAQEELRRSQRQREERTVLSATDYDLLPEKVMDYFKTALSSIIKLPASRIEADTPFANYGIDSIMVLQLTNELEKSFGSLSKILFFEYQTIEELTGYFLEAYREPLIALLAIRERTAISCENKFAATPEPLMQSPRRRRRPRFASPAAAGQETAVSRDIAIIGVAGRYPQARNLAEYWNNLKEGKDCITEIPKERWNHNLYFDADKHKPGKTYSKWGGFMDGVDQFDPLFFNISPREAEYMDPQERLFLQCVYETIEDAGYTREALAKYQGLGLEGNVGVFVGVMYEEYQLYGAQEQERGRMIALGGNPSSIANRVSYFCNFHGPSMAVDTMCSSSLTAIHMACKSLQQGGCELAIAGGVNVSIHPNKYLGLAQGKFASSKGRCESFGEGGDGYVPGEGVGAILLKPLAKAVADGDHIYGVIKGTAINHGGKANGYSVPNPNAQAGVIEQALKESGLDAREISYLEAHGTGTSLGDPIEITGLSKAFQKQTKDTQFCAIGSAKSNIGHCESAAGIAGVTKVLLQMKHGQLVPSLHSEVLNPYIDFSQTPFAVQQTLTEWKRPIIEIDGKTKECPRAAGISSFGAGGSNAHIVIAEYLPQSQEALQADAASQNPVVMILSAKDEERLKEQASQLLDYMQGIACTDSELRNIAYTLQVGREAMEERLGFIADSIEEVKETLQGVVEGRDSVAIYRGQVKQNKDAMTVFAADEELQEAITKWIKRRKYRKLAEVWAKGVAIDWRRLYGENTHRRISLPTYPFAREQYWVPKEEIQVSAVTGEAALNKLHPLLHQNISSLSGQRFTLTLTGQEFFLNNHVIQGHKVLPGVAYLEIARAAIEFAVDSDTKKALVAGQIQSRLKNVVWIRPLEVESQSVQIQIELYEEEDGEIIYEIYRETGEEDFVYSQGSATLSPAVEIPTLDLEKIQAHCSQKGLTSQQLYKIFQAMGIEYGPAHQGIEEIYVGQNQALAKLFLPSSVADTQDLFVLHPSIMDAGLQASLALMNGEKERETDARPSLPFALEELEVWEKCTSVMWAFVTYSEGCKAGDKVKKFNIDLCDENGLCCVRMKGFSSRALESEAESSKGNLLQTPVGKEKILQELWEEKDDFYQHLFAGISENNLSKKRFISAIMVGERIKDV